MALDLSVTTQDGTKYANQLAYQQATAKPTTAITPQAMANTATPTPVTAPTPAITPALPAVPQITETPEQKQADTVSQSIRDLTTSLSGESAYTGEQNKKYGLDQAQKNVNDLTSHYQSLVDQAQAIPQQIQQDAQAGGANVTKGGLQPIQTAALRNNAIQALQIHSLLSTAQGNLSSAISSIKNAVAAQFDPIRAQLDAQTKNLESLMKSPAYTVAEKNQAAQQLAAVADRQAQIDQAKQDKATSLAWAVEEVKNGAPPLLAQQMQGLTPQQILQLPNLGQYLSDPNAKALQLAQLEASRQATAASKQSMDLNAQKAPYEVAQIKANTSKINAEALKASREALKAMQTTTTDENGNVIETGNYDALTIGRYNRAANAATVVLQKNPTFKNILGSSAYLDRIESAVHNPGSVGDQELLDAFTQLNTGGNRVTEAQVHLITNNQSLSDFLNKVQNKFNTGGALSNEQRNEIVSLSQAVYKKYQESYKPLYEDATKRLQAQGIPKEFWNIPSPDTLSRAVGQSAGATVQASTPDEAIKASGQTYAQIMAGLKAQRPNEIPVFDKTTGQIGTVPASEANQANYIRM